MVEFGIGRKPVLKMKKLNSVIEPKRCSDVWSSRSVRWTDISRIWCCWLCAVRQISKIDLLILSIWRAPVLFYKYLINFVDTVIEEWGRRARASSDVVSQEQVILSSFTARRQSWFIVFVRSLVLFRSELIHPKEYKYESSFTSIVFTCF